MSEVQRICVQCGQANPMEARFCARCGYDSQGALPAQRSGLPAVVGRAALPVLAGVAGLALRAGWRLLQSRLAHGLASQATATVTPAPKVDSPAPNNRAIAKSEGAPPARPRRTIRIRSTWAMGDANGVWRQGASEHIIELDD